jgi:transcription initiation factor TFIIIB Brf1 subunit/transcription initiation factor TFIIB
MSQIINSCSHKKQLVDYREGCVVCEECGLVTEAVFENENYLPDKYDDEHCGLTKKESEYIREMLERLNLPSANFPHIAEKILQKKNRGESVSEATMTHCFYLSLADMNIPFSVNDISSITGIKHSRISKDKNCKDSNIVIIKSEDILERACSKLNLNFKQYTLIKENISKTKSINGFNPSTVISAHIYFFCKQNNINITLKRVCSITGISCMSILRYMKKNELSSRTPFPER